MRAHKAIIVTDVGGNTESVRHESEALVVPAAKNIELEVAIARMLEDRTLRERLSEAAYLTFLNEFTEDITVKKTALWLSQFA
jgi:glycosyltransferase involved in cell wall biosynthesis